MQLNVKENEAHGSQTGQNHVNRCNVSRRKIKENAVNKANLGKQSKAKQDNNAVYFTRFPFRALLQSKAK